MKFDKSKIFNRQCTIYDIEFEKKPLNPLRKVTKYYVAIIISALLNMRKPIADLLSTIPKILKIPRFN